MDEPAGSATALDATWPRSASHALRSFLLAPLCRTLHRHKSHCLSGELDKDHGPSVEQHLDKHLTICEGYLVRLDGFRDSGIVDIRCNEELRKLGTVIRGWASSCKINRDTLSRAPEQKSSVTARNVLQSMETEVQLVLFSLKQIHAELKAIDHNSEHGNS